jgi:hypothetical protein
MTKKLIHLLSTVPGIRYVIVTEWVCEWVQFNKQAPNIKGLDNEAYNNRMWLRFMKPTLQLEWLDPSLP